VNLNLKFLFVSVVLPVNEPRTPMCVDFYGFIHLEMCIQGLKEI